MRSYIRIAERLAPVNGTTKLSRLNDEEELVVFNVMYDDSDQNTRNAISIILQEFGVEDFTFKPSTKLTRARVNIKTSRKTQEAIVRKLKMGKIDTNTYPASPA